MSWARVTGVARCMYSVVGTMCVGRVRYIRWEMNVWVRISEILRAIILNISVHL